MAAADSVSLVQFLDLSTRPGHCGYCGGEGAVSQGMFVERLLLEDYQQLLDRGWRRSGSYVYKPVLEATCCPLYTIRCPAAMFAPSRSQRKALAKVHSFIRDGEEKGMDTEDRNEKEKFSTSNKTTDIAKKPATATQSTGSQRVEGLKKKKAWRMEKRLEKASKAEQPKEPKASKNLAKPLSDLLPAGNLGAVDEVVDQGLGGAHSFSLRLVRASMADRVFRETFEESFLVYREYQTVVHGDPAHECDMRTFAMFLCDSPLVGRVERGVELGAFHQHYLVDGRIVAVAVLDILPSCLSSVYLYYSPQFWGRRLSPGTYSAIREVQLTLQLNSLLPSLQHYYMGYYVHSCPKMRYKAALQPSHLLSPTLLSWHPLPPCLPLLDASKYSTLEEVEAVEAGPATLEEEMGKVRLLVDGNLSTWAQEGEGMSVPSRLVVYRRLVGQALAEAMALQWEGEELEEPVGEGE